MANIPHCQCFIVKRFSHSWMFWGNQGISSDETSGTIIKAAMDGSDQQILKNSAVYWPTGMQYDRISISFFLLITDYNSLMSMLLCALELNICQVLQYQKQMIAYCHLSPLQGSYFKMKEAN